MFLFRQQHSPDAYRTVIGAILIKMATGLITIWGNTNIYYLSYLKSKGESIKPQSNSVVLLASIIPISVLTLLSTKMSNKYGYEFVIKVSALVFMLAPYMMNFVTGLWGFATSILILPGAAFAISSIPLMNIVWTQFPTHKNKVTAIIVFFFSLSSVLWNYLFVMLVNPKNLVATVQGEGRLYFDSNVAHNVLKATNIISTITGLCFVSGSFLLRQKKSESPYQGTQMQSFDDANPGALYDDNQSNPRKSINVWTLALSANFLLIYAASFITSVFPSYSSINFKLIFLPAFNDDHFLTYVLIGYTISSMAATFLWGWLGDKKGIASTMLILTLVDGFCKTLIYFTKSKFTFGLYYVLIGIFDKGMVTIVGPGLVELFGIQGGTELLPFKASSVILTYAVVPIAQILTVDTITPLDLLQYLSLFNLLAIIPSAILWRKYGKY